MSETPRTDEHLRMKAENGQVAVVNREFARQLECENNKLRILLDKARRGIDPYRELKQKNEDLRNLLDKANQALACFVDLRGMTASELKSAHNGICILLEKTKMLDAIKAGVEEDGEK